MDRNATVEVHLYGKLRRVGGCQDTSSECIASVSLEDDATIADVLARLGVALEETSNLFLNGELSAPAQCVRPGDRLGVFPNDMALLYRWYFAKEG